MQKIKVTQVGSVISNPQSIRRVLRGLGLRGIGKTRIHNDDNCIRGMINKVRHLVRYEIIDG